MRSAEDAAIWARRILPAKNALNSADARQIEDAFRARQAVVEGATDGPDGHAPAVMSGSSAQQEEGSIRKLRPASIDKSHLPYPEPRRIRDRDHVRFVAKQPCLICGRKPADPYHLRFVQHRALGRKVSDEFTVPLCRGHHREVHRSGDEAAGPLNRASFSPVHRRERWGPRRAIAKPAAEESLGIAERVAVTRPKCCPAPPRSYGRSVPNAPRRLKTGRGSDRPPPSGPGGMLV